MLAITAPPCAITDVPRSKFQNPRRLTLGSCLQLKRPLLRHLGCLAISPSCGLPPRKIYPVSFREYELSCALSSHPVHGKVVCDFVRLFLNRPTDIGHKHTCRILASPVCWLPATRCQRRPSWIVKSPASVSIQISSGSGL